MPSVVSRIKDRMHGGRDYDYDDESDDTRRFEGSHEGRDSYSGEHDPSQPPGSFPNTNTNTGYDEPTSHHADGHKYVAPHGTHVSRGQGHGHSLTGRGEVTDSNKLMDPADRGTGSNVLEGTGAGSEIHRRDVPSARGYEGSDYSALPSGHHQGRFGDTTTTTTSAHFPQGQHDTTRATGLDHSLSTSQHDRDRHSNTAATAAGGAAPGGIAASQLPDRSRHHDTDQRDYASTGSDGRSGSGVYNTVAGRGSNDGTNAVPREAGDPRITSGPLKGMGVESHNQHGGAMVRDSVAAPAIAGGPVGAAGSGSGSGSGPAVGLVPARLDAHSNAKVMHRCSSCGHDDDITHYFKKDLIYRIDHS